MKAKKTKIISANILYLFFDKVYGASASIFFLALLTRYLGPEMFGIWSYVLSFASIAVPLSTLGTNFTVVKKFSSHLDDKEVAGQAFLVRLLASVVTSLVLYSLFVFLGESLLEKQDRYTLAFFLLAITINNLNLTTLYNENKLKNGKTVIARNMGLTLGTIIKVYLIYNNATICQIAAATVLESIIFLIVGHYLTELSIAVKLSIRTLHQSVELARESFPLFLSSIVVIIYLKADIILLKHIVSPEAAGYYAAAARISEMLYAVPVAISTVFFPLILKEINKGAKNTSIRVRFYAIVFYVCLIISVTGFFLSKEIVNIIYGTEFKRSAVLFSIHCLSVLLIGFLTSSSKELIARNKFKLIFYRDLTGLLVNIILNVIFIPKHGALAAAITTVISYFIAAVFSNLFFFQTRQVLKLMLKSPMIIFNRT